MNRGSMPQAAATAIGFSLLPGPGDVQARILARRQVETGLCLALLHHPVSTDVEVAGIRIARDHSVAGAGVASAIKWPVARDRQLIEIDVIAETRCSRRSAPA